MDMTPQPNVERPEVAVVAVEVSDPDEVCDAADQGGGELRGRETSDASASKIILFCAAGASRIS